MTTATMEYARKEHEMQHTVGQPKWQRIILLTVQPTSSRLLIGWQLPGCSARWQTDGHAGRHHARVFSDFLIPGIILFGLGILNTAAFVTVLRKAHSEGIMAALALGGLGIWFSVEIIILQELHWLHAMWGLPVVVGGLMAIQLIPSRYSQKALLVCGILSSLLYVAMNIFVPMGWDAYSSTSQTVSELSAIDAPTRPLWVLLGIIYTFLLIAFGWGVLKSDSGNRPLRIVGGLLLAYGIISLAWPFAPMHLREVLATAGGTLSDTMHIVFAMATILLMLLAIGFGAAVFGKQFRLYSIVTFVILLAFGILTFSDSPGISKNQPTPLIGVWGANQHRRFSALGNCTGHYTLAGGKGE